MTSKEKIEQLQGCLARTLEELQVLELQLHSVAKDVRDTLQSDAKDAEKTGILPGGRLDTSDAAKYIGYSVKTLAIYRSQGKGPRFIKRGRVFYYKEDIDRWFAETQQDSAKDEDDYKKTRGILKPYLEVENDRRRNHRIRYENGRKPAPGK